MNKKILVAAIACVCCVGSLTASVIKPAGDTRYDLAVNLMATDGRPEAFAKATAELEKAIEEGDGRAAVRLGDLTLRGFADGDAYAKALAYYRKAVELDAPGAKAAYAVALARNGYYAGRDSAEGRALLAQAFPLLKEAAETKDRNVLWHLGILEVTGAAGPADSFAGHQHIHQAADAGHGQAAMFVANRFRSMVPTQLEGELAYLKIAANAGIPSAKARIAEYEARWAHQPADAAPPAMGGVTTSPQQSSVFATVPASVPAAAPTAVPAPSLATAEAASLRAQLDSTTREVEALRSKLAEAERRAGQVTPSDLIALNNAGLKAVMDGDYETAVLKFREAAKHDYAPSLANLGLMYLNGTGVTVDGRQAVALFARAAKQGNLTAAENIARAYDFGLGVHKDRSRAITWYQNAQAMGSTIAVPALERLRSD